MKKRGIIIGDMHCGHVAGLTPPEFIKREYAGSTTKRNKWVRLQTELWAKFSSSLKKFAPYHFGLYMGDGIDGRGKRSGGSELVESDIDEQVNMAVAVCNRVWKYAEKGFSWVGVYGTPYHTGQTMDHENKLADGARFKKLGSHEWVNVNGCIFDLKHHVGTSAIPHGRHTAVSREKMWNSLWAERKLVPKANIILRGHVHYHNFCGGPGWVAMTTPALQGMGSKYGSRICSGLVDWGFIVVDVNDDGSFSWHAETMEIEAQKAKVIKL